jgi:hypothetical protein
LHHEYLAKPSTFWPGDRRDRHRAQPSVPVPTVRRNWRIGARHRVVDPEASSRREIRGPFPPEEIRRFLDTFLYTEDAFMVDEVTRLDSDERIVEARMETLRALPVSELQRISDLHPAHVSAADLLQATGSLGCLHAWFFHGCRWDEGWVGFGNRIHRADFKQLARRGPPLRLVSRETKTRVGPRRIVLRYEFDFWQDDQQVYFGDQTAMFFRDASAPT